MSWPADLSGLVSSIQYKNKRFRGSTSKFLNQNFWGYRYRNLLFCSSFSYGSDATGGEASFESLSAESQQQ